MYKTKIWQLKFIIHFIIHTYTVLYISVCETYIIYQSMHTGLFHKNFICYKFVSCGKQAYHTRQATVAIDIIN